MKRLARQLATEAALLVVAATMLGLVVSAWLAVLLQDLPFLAQARWRDVTAFDWRVLALSGGLMLLLTALVSLAPVLGLRRLGVAASSRHVTARAGAAQHLAATTQIAVACVLSGIALGFGGYLAALLAADPGYDTADVHMVTLVQPDGPWGFSADADAVLVERARRREAMLALPGVEAVAFGSAVPGRSQSGFVGEFQLEDGTNEPVRFSIYSADAAYARMLGLSLAFGSGIDESHAGGMMVNEKLARALWGRSDVSGESIPYGLMGGDSTEIVGVLADVSFGHPAAEVEPMAWLAALPISAYEPILIRSRWSTAELRILLQGLSDEGRLGVEISDIERLDDLVASLTAADRARSALAGASALLVVVLAGFGFYGTQRYMVSAGRREYAIHASVGAGPRALGRLVLRRGLAMGMPGLLLGGALALALVAWLRDDFSRGSLPAWWL